MASVLLAILAALTAASCGDDKPSGSGGNPAAPSNPGNTGTSGAGGPIDGNWKVVDVRCDGRVTDLSSAGLVVAIQNTSFNTKFNASESCSIQVAAAASYPGGNTVVVGPNQTSCVPAGCDAACATGTDSSGSETLQYSLQGNQLTLTQPRVGDELGYCAQGEESVLRLQKSG